MSDGIRMLDLDRLQRYCECCLKMPIHAAFGEVFGVNRKYLQFYLSSNYYYFYSNKLLS